MSSTKARALTPLGEGMKTLPSKLYFRIGEVAGMVGVEPHVLRYWEREFRAIRPTKSSKGQRVYSRKDVENLLRVRALLYEEGFTIAGAKKKLSRSPGENESIEAAEAAEAARQADAREGDVEPRTSPREPRTTSSSAKTALAVEPSSPGSSAAAPQAKPLAVSAHAALPHKEVVLHQASIAEQSNASRHAEELRTVRASLLELRAELESLLGELEAE